VCSGESKIVSHEHTAAGVRVGSSSIRALQDSTLNESRNVLVSEREGEDRKKTACVRVWKELEFRHVTLSFVGRRKGKRVTELMEQ